MPQLDFITQRSLTGTWSVEDSDDTVTAAMRTWAIMGWPNDEERRNEFLATLGAKAVGHLRTLSPPEGSKANRAKFEDVRNTVTAAMHTQWMMPYGGETTVADAPGWNALVGEIGKQAIVKWRPTGWIVFFLMAMRQNHMRHLRGGPSVAKAVHLILEKYPHPETPNNRKDIMKAWSEMKPVAHLCGAFLLLHIATSKAQQGSTVAATVDAFFSDLPRFLSMARLVQRFGLGFQPHAQREPLFSRNALWLVPDNLDLPKLRLKFEPLPPDHLTSLDKYRAPKRV